MSNVFFATSAQAELLKRLKDFDELIVAPSQFVSAPELYAFAKALLHEARIAKMPLASYHRISQMISLYDTEMSLPEHLRGAGYESAK